MTENIDRKLLEAHQCWLDAGVGTAAYSDIAEFTVEDVMGYGTTVEEKIRNREDLIRLLMGQREQVKGIDIMFDVKPVHRYVSDGQGLAVFLDELKIILTNSEGDNTINMRLSSIYEHFPDNWKMVSFHASVGVDSEGDTCHQDELKRKNQELEKLVDERTTELKKSLEDLKQTQEQLIHSEKMATLGELIAGIAHEIQNPLNFVNNFSEINRELINELKAEKELPDSERNGGLVEELLFDIYQNLEKINQHGKRADNIVKGMLLHSRKSEGERQPTNVNGLADEYFRLAYHGLRAADKSFNATLNTDFDESIGKVNVMPQELGRVILNLINNAFYAIQDKQNTQAKDYIPTIWVGSKKISGSSAKDELEISVRDNGNGIPKEVQQKIFQPFFTTKPSGKGTGLGLSLSYEIVKAHGGTLTLLSEEGKGTELSSH